MNLWTCDGGRNTGKFVRMPTPVPVPRTVGEVFDRVLAVDPDRELLVTRSGRFSYADVDRLANRAAHALASLGISPGDRVAGALPNDTMVVVAFHGAMRLGAVWVGVNRALAPPEKEYLLIDSGTSLLLCDAPTAEQLGDVAGVQVVVSDEGESGGVWSDAMVAADDVPVGVDVDPLAAAGIAYTSGTTGYPKGAVHSQYNLLMPGAALVASRGYGSNLRKGDSLPLTILNMQVLTTLLVAQAGGCSVIMDRIDAVGVAEWIRDERVALWNGPPALFHSLATMDEVTPEDLASLEEVWTGGADCPEAVRAMFERKFGVPVSTTYGLSEAPTVVTIDDRDGTHVSEASGRPLPHLDVQIVDDEVCVGAATTGPWAGSYHPMLGYWEKPDATAASLRDGYLHTGDLGFVDDRGYLHIRDRKSLVIIRGGANVYPAEVERVLHELDGVAACAVVGLADDRLGERVAAAIELAPGSTLTGEQLTAHCLANLAKYKVPERWVFVDGFPRNSMNKIQRRELGPFFD
jgi:long-chain acyl-CoA synthetase